jgi:uncharacterized protein (TIGR02284 family)
MAEPDGRAHPISSDAGISPTDPLPGATIADAEAAHVRPGDPGTAAYPVSESEYWRVAFCGEPYYESGRGFEDYSSAYELGWVGCNHYGGDFDIAERVLANDWPMRKGVSGLTWEQALPAVRAGWQRAEMTRSCVSDGSAAPDVVLQTLNELLENARDGELGFRDAAAHSHTPELVALFERLAQGCADAGAGWHGIQGLGGVAGESVSMSGAAHRVWLQIRSLFGGASDGTLLAECERGLQTLSDRYREALGRNLPAELHGAVQRQFEEAQRHRDHIRRLRNRSGRLCPLGDRAGDVGGATLQEVVR